MKALTIGYKFSAVILGTLAAAGCGPSKFSGSGKITKSAETVTPVTGEQSPKAPVTNNIVVNESFKQLRASNSGSAAAYGVGVLSLTASELLQGQKIISVERTGMSDDIRFVLCQVTGEPVATPAAAPAATPAATTAAAPAQSGTQLFSQTMNCFLIFKGLKNPASVHRFYPGIKRVARIGSADAQSDFSSSAALCVVPEGDSNKPCEDSPGRILLKDIVMGKSMTDMGHEGLPFPDDAAIAADLNALPK